MWNVHPQSVTHFQRRLAAKFQFVNLRTETDKHIILFCHRQQDGVDS